MGRAWIRGEVPMRDAHKTAFVANAARVLGVLRTCQRASPQGRVEEARDVLHGLHGLGREGSASRTALQVEGSRRPSGQRDAEHHPRNVLRCTDALPVTRRAPMEQRPHALARRGLRVQLDVGTLGAGLRHQAGEDPSPGFGGVSGLQDGKHVEVQVALAPSSVRHPWECTSRAHAALSARWVLRGGWRWPIPQTPRRS
ncbi:hypothetical protein D7Y23_27275 [Corallococcus sp. AB050B]|nr:hypothetical protein D7Y23_27275 [Corallococcus sp. AB050B]